MKIHYYGSKDKTEAGPQQVCAIIMNDHNVVLKQEIVRHVEKHSPDGMNWGYGGSGPADCALSILKDFNTRTNCSIPPEEIYQNFKWKFIAPSGDVLKISVDEIINWIYEIQGITNEESKNIAIRS